MDSLQRREHTRAACMDEPGNDNTPPPSLEECSKHASVVFMNVVPSAAARAFERNSNEEDTSRSRSVRSQTIRRVESVSSNVLQRSGGPVSGSGHSTPGRLICP